MQTVYLIQEPRGYAKDLSSAKDFGPIKMILSETDNPSVNASKCIHKIYQALKDFKPGDMLFSAGGDHWALFQAAIVLKDLGYNDEIKVLHWQRDRDLKGQRKSGYGYYIQGIMPMGTSK